MALKNSRSSGSATPGQSFSRPFVVKAICHRCRFVTLKGEGGGGMNLAIGRKSKAPPSIKEAIARLHTALKECFRAMEGAEMVSASFFSEMANTLMEKLTALKGPCKRAMSSEHE